MKSFRGLLCFLVVLLAPSVVFGNAGTALMWASELHMLLGNILLGILEGLLLAKFFKVSKKRAIGFLIVANYFSAWLGMEFFVDYLNRSIELTIENLRYWLRVFMWVAFGVTLVVEFPFFWWVLRKLEHSFAKAVKATILLHCISYALLLFWYGKASDTSMITDLEIVPAETLVPEEKYVLYYLSNDGKSVQRMMLDGVSKAEHFAEVTALDDNDRLFVRSSGNARFDLFLHLDLGYQTKEVEIEQAFADLAAIDPRMKRRESHQVEGTWYNFGVVASLASDSDWKYFVGFWPSSGIHGWRKEENQDVYYGLETPISEWSVRNAIHLEGNYLLFQLGKDQICLLHPDSQRIALVARGKGPVVSTPKN